MRNREEFFTKSEKRELKKMGVPKWRRDKGSNWSRPRPTQDPSESNHQRHVRKRAERNEKKWQGQ